MKSIKGKVNCPNCAAPIDPHENKCQYCGTSYFDMTSIDFNSGKPVWLKFRVNGFTFTQLAVPTIGTMEASSERVYATGRYGTTVGMFDTSKELTTAISFRAIPQGENNVLCEVTL